MNFLNLKKITYISAAAVLMAGSLTNLPAISSEDHDINATGSLDPDYYLDEMGVGRTVSFDRTITVQIDEIIETTTAAPDKLDILFLADNTDSMGPAIQNVQDNAEALLNALTNTYDDLQVGVARYYGDPQEQIGTWEGTGEIVSYDYEYTYLNESDTCYGDQGESWICYKYDVKRTNVDTGKIDNWTSLYNESTYLNYGQFHTSSSTFEASEYITSDLGADNAYQLQTAVDGGTLQDAIAAINDWSASSGNDWSEGNFFGLHQAATNGAAISGYSTGEHTNWRSDAKKIIVWFGDAQSHTNTVSQVEVIQALNDNDISVVAIHTESTDKSMTHGLNANSQASSIANDTSGAFASVYSSELADTMQSLIGTAAVETTTISPSIDLSFANQQGDIEGLNVTYVCIDVLGCDDVQNGDIRNIRMDITAESSGSYSFKTIENATGALADNTIDVHYPD